MLFSCCTFSILLRDRFTEWFSKHQGVQKWTCRSRGHEAWFEYNEGLYWIATDSILRAAITLGTFGRSSKEMSHSMAYLDALRCTFCRTFIASFLSCEHQTWALCPLSSRFYCTIDLSRTPCTDLNYCDCNYMQ